jgi:hypothetical protein
MRAAGISKPTGPQRNDNSVLLAVNTPSKRNWLSWGVEIGGGVPPPACHPPRLNDLRGDWAAVSTGDTLPQPLSKVFRRLVAVEITGRPNGDLDEVVVR